MKEYRDAVLVTIGLAFVVFIFIVITSTLEQRHRMEMLRYMTEHGIKHFKYEPVE